MAKINPSKQKLKATLEINYRRNIIHLAKGKIIGFALYMKNKTFKKLAQKLVLQGKVK